MTARRVTPLIVLAVLVAQLNCLVSDAHAQQPPVEYQITRIPTDQRVNSPPTGINNLGMVAGSTWETDNKLGYIYDHAGVIGLPQTLHWLTKWIPNLDGWSGSRCLGINDVGQVVGYLESTIDGEVIRVGFYLDLDILSEVRTPKWEYLPAPTGSTFYYGRKVNNHGTVVVPFTKSDGSEWAYLFNPGNYDPNDPTTDYAILSNPATGIPLPTQYHLNLNSSNQVVGRYPDDTYFRLTPGDSLEPLPSDFTAWPAINDSGTIPGSLRVENVKGRKTSTSDYAAKVTAAGEVELVNDSFLSTATDINESGDVVGGNLSGGQMVAFLYHSDTPSTTGHGLINLDDLVTGDGDDLEFWLSGTVERSSLFMNDRNITGFGQIVVQTRRQVTSGKGKNRTRTREDRVFLLTPVQ